MGLVSKEFSELNFTGNLPQFIKCVERIDVARAGEWKQQLTSW